MIGLNVKVGSEFYFRKQNFGETVHIVVVDIEVRAVPSLHGESTVTIVYIRSDEKYKIRHNASPGTFARTIQLSRE
jgi:hypothetical protein